MEVTANMLRELRAAIDAVRPDDVGVFARGKYHSVDDIGFEEWPGFIGRMVTYMPGVYLVQWEPDTRQATALEPYESKRQWTDAQADEDEHNPGNLIVIVGWTITADGRRELAQVINPELADQILKSIA